MTANFFKLSIFSLIALLCLGCSPDTTVSEKTPQPGGVRRNPLPKELERECSVLHLTMGENQGNAFVEPSGRLVMSTRVTTLIRELTRQAVLIAARDELGLTTRDEMLGESATGDDVRSLLIEFNVGTYPQFSDANVEFHPSDVRFSRDQYHKNHTPPYASVPMLFQLHSDQFLPKIEELERLSRESFKETLQYLNLKGEENVPARGETTIPESVRNLLDDLHPVSQFEALREIHGLIRKNGESLPLLKGLVRGYAQLYLMTEHHKTTGSRVFQCRSILYAQRAVALYGKTAETLSLKASALSLATCFRLARINYDEADKAGDKNDSIPSGENAWMRVARPLADYDFDAVAGLTSDETVGDLAKLVLFMMYDYSDAETLTFRKGTELSENFPCARIFDGMMRAKNFNGVFVEQVPYQVLCEENLAERLAKIDSLPKRVRDALEAVERKGSENRRPSRDFGALFSPPFDHLARYQIPLAETPLSEDAAEMSFPSLARILREEAFVQIELVSRMIASRNGNPDSFLESTETLLDDHPLKNALFQYMRDNTKRNHYADQMKDWNIPFPLLDVNSYTVWDRIPGKVKKDYRLPPPDAVVSYAAAADVYRDSFWIYKRDQARRLNFDLGGTLEAGRRLGYAAPNCPLALRLRIQDRWRFNDADVRRWMPRIVEFHYIGNSILDRLAHGDDVELQEKIWKMMYDNNPDYYTATHLAYFYRSHGKTDEGIRVLEHYLTTPDAASGLGRAGASELAAKLHMEEKRFDEALPFAQAAAASYSNWGLVVLGGLYEAKGEFKKAAKYFRDSATNYSDSPNAMLTWFQFCHRTGDSAISTPEKKLEAVWKDSRNHQKDATDFGFFFKTMQKPFPEDLVSFPDLYLHEYNQDEATARMALLDLLDGGDTEKTLEFFPYLRKEWSRSQPMRAKSTELSDEWVLLLDMIEPELRAGGPTGRFEEKELDDLLQIARNRRDGDSSVLRYAYLLGRYYDLAGNHAKAVEFYKLCVGQTDYMNNLLRSLALNELRKDGFSKEDYLAVMKDPETIVPYKAFPKGASNRLCTLIFRDYSDNPSSRLKPAAPRNSKIGDPRFLHSHDSLFEKGVYYKVGGGRFDGKEFGPEQSMLRIRIREGWLRFQGFGRTMTFSFDTTDLSSDPIKVRLTDWGSEATFRGLMSLGGSPKLGLNLDEGGDYPKVLDDPDLPNLVLFELETTDATP